MSDILFRPLWHLWYQQGPRQLSISGETRRTGAVDYRVRFWWDRGAETCVTENPELVSLYDGRQAGVILDWLRDRAERGDFRVWLADTVCLSESAWAEFQGVIEETANWLVKGGVLCNRG